MEILAQESIMTAPWWVYVLSCILGGAIIIGFSAIVHDDSIIGSIAAVCIVVSIVLLFVLPTSIPNGKIKYTVEITDQDTYKELVDQGYSFKRLYENKNIYEIVGEELYINESNRPLTRNKQNQTAYR